MAYKIGCNERRFHSNPGYSILIFLLITIFFSPSYVTSGSPKFDPSTLMRLVLVPADAQVGSVIYRLRATDEEFDYPLIFEFVGDITTSAVKIESLPCTKYNSVCQANVVLSRRLEAGRYYDFQVAVTDTKGDTSRQLCSITATNFSTPHDIIFPHKPGIIQVPEDAKKGTELDYVIARKNILFQKPVYLELWGSPLFAIRQKIISAETTEGTIFLLGPLDFEKQAMYHIKILANDAYAEPGQDSRNIAGIEIVVIVQDVQDQPPVFIVAPPVTKLQSGLLPGDKILKVHAEDGDKGNPREIRYGLVSEGNPFTSFFDINDTSGEIFLMRPLEDIAALTHIGDPVLLTIIAEEVKIGRDEPPAMSSTIQLAFFLPERTNSAPYFENDHYVTRLDENPPQGTALTFVEPYVARVYDDDIGKNGVFALTLLNNNGTFEISPNVAERSTTFLIRVRDNILLDYEEREYVQFKILAQELGPVSNLSASVNVTVYLNDVNDNPPIFDQSVYIVELPENMTAGTKVVDVHATDLDTSDLGDKIKYTTILGYLNTSLNLDSENGTITVVRDSHGFDREIMPEYHLYIEAKDNDGQGNRAQVPLIIKLIDINDEIPQFEKDMYEFILAPDLESFSHPAFIHAIDKDATSPNNEVRYEIINGNYENKIIIDNISGELTTRQKITFNTNPNINYLKSNSFQDKDITKEVNLYILTARAYDLGVPVRYSTTTIRIYPPESRVRTLTFLVPGLNPDKAKTEETLSAITGGKVIIHDIRPQTPQEKNSNIASAQSIPNRSVVTATVLYDSSSIVDIYHIQQRLLQHNSSFSVMLNDENSSDALYKAENKLLFWLLILLATLVALTILILLLCCICSWCPLYGGNSKRIVNISRTEDDVHLVHREKANGKQTKSVQVADWVGSREAWSSEKATDSRTKPTRWEFHNGSEQHEKNLTEQFHIPHDYSNNNQLIEAGLANKVERQAKTRAKNFTKDYVHSSLNNSRTNLILNDDVSLEDIYNKNQVENIKIINGSKIMTDFLPEDANENGEMEHETSERRHAIKTGNVIVEGSYSNTLKNKKEVLVKDDHKEILHIIAKDKDDHSVTYNDENIYANINATPSNKHHTQLMMVDNVGKEILLRRFIEEQSNGKQIIREHYQIVPGATFIQNMPNEIPQNAFNKMDTYYLEKSQPNSMIFTQPDKGVKVIHVSEDAGIQTNVTSRHDSSDSALAAQLEKSLQQQNDLLRKILLEKEKAGLPSNENYIPLETQSLPGHSLEIATQTEREAATQTDIDFETIKVSFDELITRRKARSENDDSFSDDSYEYVNLNFSDRPTISMVKKKKPKKRFKSRNEHQPSKRIIMLEDVRKKLRTPITEEVESQFEILKPAPPIKPLRDTKANILRTKKNEQKLHDNQKLKKLGSQDSMNSKENHKFKRTKNQVSKNDDSTDIYYNIDSDANDDEIVIQTSFPSKNQTVAGPSKGEKHHFAIHISKKQDEIERLEKNYVSRSSSEDQHLQEGLLKKRNLGNSSKKLAGGEVSSSSQQSSNLKPYNSRRLKKKSNNQNDNNAAENQIGTDESNYTTSKYMDWYQDKKNNISKTDSLSLEKQSKEKAISKTSLNLSQEKNDFDESSFRNEVTPKHAHLLKDDVMINKQHILSLQTDTNHPLLQHSEHRFERESIPELPIPPTKLPHYMYPETPPIFINNKDLIEKRKPSKIKENINQDSNNKINVYIEDENSTNKTAANSQKQLNAATLEDDHDSGIAMNSVLHNVKRRIPITEKKSVFTIAYDNISQVQKINSGVESPQNS